MSVILGLYSDIRNRYLYKFWDFVVNEYGYLKLTLDITATSKSSEVVAVTNALSFP